MKENLKSHLMKVEELIFLYQRSSFPELEYVFKHALIQEVAYSSLLDNKRKEIHRKIGGAIEELYSSKLEEYYEILAYHYSNSDDLEKAYFYLKLAAKKATQKYSLWEAFNYFREAIKVLNQLPATGQNRKEQLEIRLLSAPTMHVLNHPENSLEMLQEGERLSKELKDKDSLGIFKGKLGVYYAHHGEPLLAIGYAEKPFRKAQQGGKIDFIAKTACDLCNVYYYASEFSKIIDLASKVLVLLEEKKREYDFFGFRYNVYSGLCAYTVLSSGMLGKLREAEASYRKGVQYAMEANSVYGIGLAEICYAQSLNTIGEARNAITHCQKAINHLEQTQGVLVLGLSWGQLGYACYLNGDLKAARSSIERAINFQSEHGVAIYSCTNYLYLGIVHFDLGDFKKAQDCMVTSLNLSQKSKERHWEGLIKIWFGRILRKVESTIVGNEETYILQGINISEKLKTRPYSALGYLFLAELYYEMGQKENALENLQKAQGMFQEMEMNYWLSKSQQFS